MDIQRTLTAYINKDLLDGRGEVQEDENLLVAGIIDSLGMLRLVGYIEDQMGIQVPPEDFTIENFGSIRAMTDYLSARA